MVFFKGCTLACPWCENPESQSSRPELLFNRERCIGCGSCLETRYGGAMLRGLDGAVEPDRGRALSGAGLGLGEVCPSLALKVAGREVAAPDIVAEVMKDEAFFRKSGGGVTFSGGECLAQPSLLRELVEAFSDRGVGIAIETCLAVGWPNVASLATRPIAWLVDLKHTDGRRFAAATGGNLALVLENLERLVATTSDVTLRVPVIPGFNDDEDSLAAILSYAARLKPGGRLDLLAYHDLARGKYAALGRTYPYASGLAVDRDRLDRAVELGSSLGLDISLGG